MLFFLYILGKYEVSTYIPIIYTIYLCRFQVLVLLGPAGPYWRKSGVNRVFKPTISGRFAKRLSYVQSSHRCSHLGIDLNLLGISEMGSFLIIVLNLYSYKDIDVGNLRTIKYFRDYCRPFRNTWNTI